MVESLFSRSRIDEDELFYHREPASSMATGHRYVPHREAVNREREGTFNLQLLPDLRLQADLGNVELASAVQISESRYGHSAGEAYNSRRVRAYVSHAPVHEWDSNRELARGAFGHLYDNEAYHHLHSLNRARNPHSFYDGHHQLRSRIPWL
ncbi:hypothetical protein KP509_1Z127200 [Ceratopteris richardii]|nr:hypothetical protein KP509_1Z127200 [Ceratopteris richardii]